MADNYKDSIWYKLMTFGLEFLGLYYGSYRAFVVDNEDPENLGRLILRIPSINANSVDDTWAFPIGTWGGNNYGFNVIPRKGDMVFVEFQNGNLDYPMWKPGSYARDEKPPEFNNSNYGFKTPRGTLILINDKKDEEEVLIKHKNQSEWISIKKDILETEAKLIKLGKDGDEQAVLGDTLKSKLNQIDAKLDELFTALIQHTHTTNVGPSGPPINMVTFANIKADVQQIDMSLDEILSIKVKIDK